MDFGGSRRILWILGTKVTNCRNSLLLRVVISNKIMTSKMIISERWPSRMSKLFKPSTLRKERTSSSRASTKLWRNRFSLC